MGVILVTAGCDDGTGPGVDPTGTPITASGVTRWESRLSWSADGAEIFFIGSGHAVGAVRAAEGSLRTLHGDSTGDFVVAPDGWLYRATGSRIDRVPVGGGAAELIAEGVTGWITGHSVPPALSPDGSVLAYALVGRDTVYGGPMDPMGTRDTLVLHDLAAGNGTAAAFGVPLAFSTDGAQLAYASRPCQDRALGRPNPCEPRILDFDAGTDTALPWYEWDKVAARWWSDGDFQSLVRSYQGPGDGWVVRTHTAGTFVELATVLAPDAVVDHAAVSPDGTQLSVWVREEERLELRVLDPAAMTSVVVAVHEHSLVAGPTAAFAPDGRRIAYQVAGRVYVKDL